MFIEVLILFLRENYLAERLCQKLPFSDLSAKIIEENFAEIELGCS